MGMQNPTVSESLDKLSDVVQVGSPNGPHSTGAPFFLEGVRIVEANTAAYGKGEMVVVRIRGHQKECGIWGSYLLHQAKCIASDDLQKWWKIDAIQVPGFGKNGRPVKAFVPAEPPAQTQTAENTPAAA